MKKAILIHEPTPVGVGSSIFRCLHRLYYLKPEEILYLYCPNPLYGNNGKNVWSMFLHQPFEAEKHFLTAAFQSGLMIVENGVFNNSNNDFLFGYGNAQDNAINFKNPLKVEHYRKFIKSFLNFKQPLIDKAYKYWVNNFKDNKILSIHRRGTDMFAMGGHAWRSRHLISDEYVLGKINCLHRDFDKIFVATDEQSFVDLMVTNFGDKILTYSTMRIRGQEKIGLHFKYAKSNSETKHILGEEALIDSILMSKSNYACHMRSNISLLSILLRNDYNYEFIDDHIVYNDIG